MRKEEKRRGEEERRGGEERRGEEGRGGEERRGVGEEQRRVPVEGITGSLFFEGIFNFTAFTLLTNECYN
jgi:hypothetical protein